MALEQFKTQVLLLHSQQSTLDALGAGFSDNYSVHFATSGSEALTTLGETPIHIIVSAQDLPGMSGLEALREAKKRSPDTIGILLAGNDSSEDLEALVGDQEVFQIVRGAVQPDALIKIVENATRRMRMLTISKSANDNAANVDSSSSGLFETSSKLKFPDDDGTGEHIIMETMDNGTTIISDGTGRMPALKPEKIQVSPEAGGRGVDVLVLTKDSEFLETVRESARGLHKVHHAVTGQQAQDAVRNNRVGVLVTDAAIAGSKVELLTQSLRAHAPRLVAIVAGRRDDGDSLMELINRGQVYRFLLKPVSPGRARLAIEASVKYHLEAPATSFKGPAGAARPAAVPQKPAPAAAKPAAPKPAATKPAAASPAAARPAPAKPAAAKPAAAPDRPAPQPAAKSAPAEPADADKGESGKPAAAKAAGSQPAKGEAAERVEPRLDATGMLQVPDDKRRDMSSLESPEDGESVGGLSPPLIGAAVVGVLVVAAVLWMLLSGDAETPVVVPDEQATAATEAEAADDAATDAAADPAEDGIPADAPVAGAPETLSPASEALVPTPAGATLPATEAAYVALLDNARFARDSGRIVAPPGDNAVEWYVAARDAAPDNNIIRDELAALIERLIGMTESALLDNRLQDARDALDMVELASPQHARLAFLNAQLAQMQLRDTLDQARAAIRDARFEDAGGLLIAAEQIPGADATAIGRLSEELAAARSAQQVDDVLARANERLAAGSVTTPANDNARYFFELALANDPGNVAATQGLLVVAGRLVLNARAAIDRGEFDVATALLGDARTLDPEGAELKATEDALAAGLAARAEAERQAELERQRAEQQAAAERAAAEERRRASADLSTGSAASPAAAAAETAAGTTAGAAATTTAAATTAAAAPASKPTAQPAAEPEAPAGGAGSTAAAPDPNPGPQPIAISKLTRVNYVAPRYPRNAQRRNVSGWVDVAFTVTAAGEVGDVSVIDSTPGSVFDDAAVDAVEKWRFEPVIESGRAVPKRVAVRMSFNLQ